jgi:DNA-directed RNA polymerase subunit RPC12/RpoP
MSAKYLCEKCKSPIMKAVPVFLDGESPLPDNRCTQCGHLTGVGQLLRAGSSLKPELDVARVEHDKSIRLDDA